MFIFIIFYYYPTNVQILFHINYKTQQKDIKKASAWQNRCSNTFIKKTDSSASDVL